MKRIALGFAAILMMLTVVIGVAHTQVGRPLLAYMPWSKSMKGACPLGYDAPATAQARAESQRLFATNHRGERPALKRPALGFSLDATTKTDIQAWAVARGIRCSKPSRGHDLECQQVPAKTLPSPENGADVDSLWLDFDVHDKLIAVIALRREKQVQPILATFSQIKNLVTQGSGREADYTMNANAADLQAGLLRQASAEYRFTNYYALARATNMPDGFLLIDEYHSLN